MLSGRLPTGTVEDRSGDARRDEGRARTDRTERPTATGRDDRPRPAGTTDRDRPGRPTATDRDRAGSTPDGTANPTAGPTADLAAENRRLKRRLATERAERQAVIDRYERLLAERQGTGGKNCGGDGARERVTAGIRRVLSRLRCWSGRLRSRRE